MRFFYLRDVNGKPIGCLASDLSEGKAAIKFAVSVCNPLDEFKKNQSRHLAAGRIATDECDFIFMPQGKGEVKSRILTLIANNWTGDSNKTNINYPQRARDAAKVWLTTHDALKKAKTSPEPPSQGN